MFNFLTKSIMKRRYRILAFSVLSLVFLIFGWLIFGTDSINSTADQVEDGNELYDNEIFTAAYNSKKNAETNEIFWWIDLEKKTTDETRLSVTLAPEGLPDWVESITVQSDSSAEFTYDEMTRKFTENNFKMEEGKVRLLFSTKVNDKAQPAMLRPLFTNFKVEGNSARSVIFDETAALIHSNRLDPLKSVNLSEYNTNKLIPIISAEMWVDPDHDGIYEKYVDSMVLNDNSSVQLKYRIDMDAFYAMAGNEALKQARLDATVSKEKLTFDFSFEIDSVFYMEDGKPFEGVIGEFGNFIIEKGENGGKHKVTVTLNNEFLSKSGAEADFHFFQTVDLKGSQSEIVIVESENFSEEIPVLIVDSYFSVGKNVVANNYDYISELNTHPLLWEVLIQPESNPETGEMYVLKNAILTDKDITNGTNYEGGGFRFPNATKLGEIQKYYPDFVLKVISGTGDQQTTWVQGTDYEIKYKDDSRKEMYLSFNRDIDDTVKVCIPTVTDRDHDPELKNSVVVKPDNDKQQGATASTTIYSHDMKKSGKYEGKGITQWTVLFQRDGELTDDGYTAEAETLKDIITGGSYVKDSILVNGKKMPEGWSVVEDDNGNFSIKLAETVPPGRYKITYKTKSPDTETSVTNEINSDIGKNPGDSATVALPAITVTKSGGPSRFNIYENDTNWTIGINSKGSTDEDIFIQDWCNAGLHYYAKLAYTMEEAEAWGETNGANKDQIKEHFHRTRGITIYANGQLIPQEDYQNLIYKNNVDDGGITVDGENYAGFQLTLAGDKYAKKDIQIIVYTKLGGEEDLAGLNLGDNITNHVRATHGANSNSASVIVWNINFKPYQNGINKVGKLADGKIHWDIISNKRRQLITEKSVITDKLNYSSVNKKETTYQFMTEADLAAVVVQLYQVKSKGEVTIDKDTALTADKINTYFDKVGEPLQVGTDYKIEGTNYNEEKGGYDGYTITFLRELGYYAIGVHFDASYDISANAGKNQNNLKFDNYTSHVINKEKNQTSGSLSIPIENINLNKSGKNFVEINSTVTWEIVANVAGKVMSNIQLTDSLDENQVYIKDSIQVYPAFMNAEGAWVADTSKAPLPLTVQNTNGAGFIMSFTGNPTINYPFIITYQATVADKSVVTVKNAAKLSWGTGESDVENESYIIRQGGGSGSVRQHKVSLIKLDGDQQFLPGVGFSLEIFDGMKWVSVEENVIVPDDNTGTILFDSLLEGAYRLKETKVLNGYDFYDDWIYIDINKVSYTVYPDPTYTEQNFADYYQVVDDDQDDLKLELLAVNKKTDTELPNYQLPKAGSKEMIFLTILAVMVMGVGIYLWYDPRKGNQA